MFSVLSSCNSKSLWPRRGTYISCIVKTEAEKIEKQGSAYEIWTTILFIIYVFKNIF